MRYDAVIIGGGLSGGTAALCLQKAKLSCVLVSEGLSLHPGPLAEFSAHGGTILPGDSVVSGYMEDGHLRYVLTRNLGQTRLEASHFILATGKFFSKGLTATMDEIYEPVFGCDVYYDHDRNGWVNPDFYADQPFEHFGLITDSCGHVSIKGNTIKNLYAAGEILAGTPDIEGSALAVAKQILEEVHHAG